VGLLTGDVSINPEATCLVMTTEVLRSMLYRGSEIVREAALVVFDEIHYIKDPERGVVWEESIVLLPRAVRCAFLSATIPNAAEFAAWVARTKGAPVSVIYTDFRPTPLQHYLFPAGGDGVHLVVDETGRFREDGFAAALAAVSANAAAASASRDARAAARSGGGGKGAAELAAPREKSDIYKLVTMLIGRALYPLIVFAFSKREVDRLTAQMADVDLLGADEKALVEGIFNNAMDGLSEEDRRLPQIGAVLPILRRGIGLHHSGMLPIVKECIEILFQEGLLKVLFATETFSTGLNMPARAVVFTSARKYDGAAYRWLSSGEFIQMGGRAGRRGLDAQGTVILMLDERMEAAVAKDMLRGAPDPLYSAFHLTYPTLLNIARRAGGEKAEQLVAASFRQFQAERALPALAAAAEALDARCAALAAQLEPHERQLRAYAALLEARRRAEAALRALLNAPQVAVPFLEPGRVVRLGRLAPAQRAAAWAWAAPEGEAPRAAPPATPDGARPGGQARAEAEADAELEALRARVAAEAAARAAPSAVGPNAEAGEEVWAVVVNFERVGGGEGARASYAVDVLARCAGGAEPPAASDWRSGLDDAARLRLLPAAPAEGEADPAAAFRVLQVRLEQLGAISQVRLKMAKDLRPREARAALGAALQETLRRLPDGVPMLEAEAHLLKGGDGSAARRLQRRCEAAEEALREHPLASDPGLSSGLGALAALNGLARRGAAAREALRAARTLVLKEELRGRRKVLRKLGYLDEAGVVSGKGRVAAEVASADGLLVTELMFSGAFSELEPAALAALASCLIWREKGEGGGGGGGGGGGPAAKAPPPKLSEELAAAHAKLRETARRVAKAEAEYGLRDEVEEYVDSFSCELMPLVASWARGARFADLLAQRGPHNRLFEGSVVRAIRRIEELLRQLADGAAGVGEQALQAKCEAAAAALKRDIVFAASLFL